MRYWIFVILNKLVRKIGGRGLSRIPGLLNVYRFVYQKTKPKNTVLVNAQGYKIYMNPNDKIIFPELIIEGVWEEFETQLFRELLAPGMVVVDVGANFGYYTLIAAREVTKEGTVYAFEPEPSNYDLLCKNIQMNGFNNVVVSEKAVSNRKGQIYNICAMDFLMKA